MDMSMAVDSMVRLGMAPDAEWMGAFMEELAYKVRGFTPRWVPGAIVIMLR